MRPFFNAADAMQVVFSSLSRDSSRERYAGNRTRTIGTVAIAQRSADALYLPPLLFGLLRGMRSGRSDWKLRAMTVGIYGLVLLILIGTVMLLAEAPADALMQAAVPVLLVLPLGLVGLAAGEELAARLADRLLPGQGPGAG